MTRMCSQHLNSNPNSVGLSLNKMKARLVNGYKSNMKIGCELLPIHTVIEVWVWLSIQQGVGWEKWGMGVWEWCVGW